ncbi:serine/threonine protein kinase [Caloranaerobacter azorensis H53214]|uniref:non-specific serine/threonine protein kinase n=1 Tax=Caloranaerobacter azorensis H53214 TaxID=1156417 RepID=A0A096BIX1_9FIRM|nr:Stk1 family PASTA domain-containing Ser/Thr kinase [Caloranaerobacter azorensis]KGG81120.1 serine/threonine protein kinase [Caloranaerobacter azorensis H53214]
MKGRLLGDRYEIVEKIGGGGMALVYKAKCKLLNRYVAIKVLRTEFINNEEFINKFRRESQAAASLSHPNIVNIYDVGVEGDIYYIVMEYVKGKTLKELIREKGRLSYEETIDIAIQIARALSHAHKNHIVHRDIKPHNILVSDDGRIKVTDFGIAKAATTSTVTNTSNVIGSVHYFSPEQARGGYTNEKSDIYSLGIVMYEMVTGRVPFEGDSPISVAIKHIQEDIVTPRQFVKTIPESLEKIILKCVEKDQSLRYDSAEELLKDLEKAKELKDGSYVEINNYDDSPTRVIPAIKDDMLMNKKSNNKNKKDKKNKSNKVITISAILLALVLTSALAVGFLYIKDYLFVKEVEVPLIVGLHEDVAKQKIESLGLRFVVKKRVYSKDYKEGYIISQDIDPEDKVKVGYPIEVVVSKGEKLVKVPDLLNKYSSDIEVALSRVGLEQGKIVHQFSDIYPEGIIISQEPEPLSMVPEGTKVNFVISQGPKINYVIMPNLIGLNLENAKKEIISNGFVLGEVKYEPNNDVPKNLVTWQSYPAGAEVEENTTIDLIVSSGPSTENADGQNDSNLTENNNNKKKEEQAAQSEQDSVQEQEKVLQLIIPLPQDREKVEVKIYKIQGQSKEIIYNKVHETKEERISVTISGKGEVKYEIYYDGEFYEQKDINF